jgi:hypothetical protein
MMLERLRGSSRRLSFHPRTLEIGKSSLRRQIFFPSGTTTPVEDFTSCIANNQRLSELTIGFWRNVYKGDYGRVTFGAQYEYIKRKAFNGIGGTPSTDDNQARTNNRHPLEPKLERAAS